MKGNAKKPVTSTIDDESKFDEEEQQLQDEEERSDFDSALAVSEAHDLLDGAMHVLDDMIQQQQINSTAQSNSSAVSTERTSKSARTSTRKK